MRILLMVLLIALGASSNNALAQYTSVEGKVSFNNEPLEFATVAILGSTIGTLTDAEGNYRLTDLPEIDFQIEVSYTGFTTKTINLVHGSNENTKQLNIELERADFLLNPIVVTGTKTFKRQTDSPVIVQIMNKTALEQVQACNLAEGLRFQPGLRVETDCQTCNYTQLRMNGLGGSYAQILINGRPIFSPLTGLYGLEQIPRSMIDRIEVVRGGGSALYGSSAIAGTVNVITRIPEENSYEVSTSYQNVNGGAHDEMINLNGTLVGKNAKGGATLFFAHRMRQAYDHNGDNFSELPEIKNNSLGLSYFFQPKDNQKLEGSFSVLNEYRIGGEMLNKQPHLLQQAEERTHNVYVASLDYQINFNEDKTSFITYGSGQYTKRDHFTGILPDGGLELQEYLEAPPYGRSNNLTWQLGSQINHEISSFLGGRNVLTLGTEFISDDVFDEIEAYNYEVDQTANNWGLFAQSDWDPIKNLTLLSGFRLDVHNLMNKALVSPRVSALYKIKNTTQLRATWGTGFRAPQAFDTDLHIAFAGGGVSRVALSPNLNHERSNSFTTSINFDKSKEKFVAGFTLEGFYTKLDDAFYLQLTGEDEFGQTFEKRNGESATVKGLTLELRANYNRKIQLEAGYTLQTSEFEEAIEYIENQAPVKEFLRTPDHYGYFTMNITPSTNYFIGLNYVLTGPMKLAHFAGAPEQTRDEFITTRTFGELSFKSSYTFPLRKINSGLELSGGVKNFTNAYQQDFDTGKNRDSNYVYGPGAPRTFFLGLKLSSL